MLLFGEPGLQKSNLATLVHFSGKLRTEPMVSLDCARLDSRCAPGPRGVRPAHDLQPQLGAPACALATQQRGSTFCARVPCLAAARSCLGAAARRAWWRPWAAARCCCATCTRRAAQLKRLKAPKTLLRNVHKASRAGAEAHTPRASAPVQQPQPRPSRLSARPAPPPHPQLPPVLISKLVRLLRDGSYRRAPAPSAAPVAETSGPAGGAGGGAASELPPLRQAQCRLIMTAMRTVAKDIESSVTMIKASATTYCVARCVALWLPRELVAGAGSDIGTGPRCGCRRCTARVPHPATQSAQLAPIPAPSQVPPLRLRPGDVKDLQRFYLVQIARTQAASGVSGKGPISRG